MALQNADELAVVLDRADHLGPVFARHAYGMRAWVDLFSAHIADLPAPADKALLARLVAVNAGHMLLFRERAVANGTDPDAYVCPDEGEAIYVRIPELSGAGELAGYRLRADAAAAGEELRARVGDGAEAALAEAHELYRVRELAEVPMYAHAA